MKVKFWNRFAFLGLACLATQQIVSASTNYWLVSLQETARRGQPIITLLLGLFTSLLLPYLPASLAVVARTRWSQKIALLFTRHFVDANRANLSLYSDRTTKERTLQILSNEGLRTIEEVTQYYHQLTTSFLSIACNIVAFSLLIDRRFLIAHALSILLGYLVIRAQNARQVQYFKRAQSERVGVSRLLQCSSDNVLLGNYYNYRIWWRAFARSMGKAMYSQRRAIGFREGISLASSLTTYLPCLLLVLWIAYSRASDLNLVCDLLSLLPRLAFVLSYTYYLVFLIAQWQSMHARLRVVMEILEPTAKSLRSQLEKRISWNKISVHSATGGDWTPQSLQHWESLFSSSVGRWTLRGENGAGKSTLLLLLKSQMKDRAYYLPTHSALQFRHSTKDQSTGKQLIAQIEELMNYLPAEIYLFDEWDANLDHKNLHAISALLDRLAEKGCVIEVRHRQ